MGTLRTENTGLVVTAHYGPELLEKPGSHYSILVPYPTSSATIHLNFQVGDPSKEGVNGVTNEALLTILIDRISVQDSSLHSALNIKALNHCRLALEALEERTRDRLARGIEETGT